MEVWKALNHQSNGYFKTTFLAKVREFSPVSAFSLFLTMKIQSKNITQTSNTIIPINKIDKQAVRNAFDPLLGCKPPFEKRKFRNMSTKQTSFKYRFGVNYNWDRDQPQSQCAHLAHSQSLPHQSKNTYSFS